MNQTRNHWIQVITNTSGVTIDMNQTRNHWIQCATLTTSSHPILKSINPMLLLCSSFQHPLPKSDILHVMAQYISELCVAFTSPSPCLWSYQPLAVCLQSSHTVTGAQWMSTCEWAMTGILPVLTLPAYLCTGLLHMKLKQITAALELDNTGEIRPFITTLCEIHPCT